LGDFVCIATRPPTTSPPAAGLDLAAALVREARDLVSGVIVTAAEDDPAGLAPLLAATKT
jgi:hypothetical protein